MSESAEQINDGLLAVSDSIHRLATVIGTRQTPQNVVEHENVVSVLPVQGWRALIGRTVDGVIEYNLVSIIAWATKVRNIGGKAAICQVPLVYDSETMRGIALEEFLYTTPGAVARILEPGQEGLSTADTVEFKKEILRRGEL